VQNKFMKKIFPMAIAGWLAGSAWAFGDVTNSHFVAN